MNPSEAWVLNYLLNSLWQVPLVMVAAWVAARLVRRLGARVEHRVWVGAMALEVMLPACSVRLGVVWDVLVRLAPWRAKGLAGGGTRIVIGAGTAYGMSLFHLPPGVVAAVGVLYGAACSTLRGGWRGAGGAR